MRRGVILAGLLGASAAVAQVDPFAFLPDGGTASLALAYPDATDRQDALGASRSAEDWQAELSDKGLGTAETRTLAAWLARVAPLAPGDPLPPDGRDLALAQCQSCHSLFTGFLMQRRDRNGWMSVFASPFHLKLPMTATEREIFADYAAINMPMRPEDVPPELRF